MQRRWKTMRQSNLWNSNDHKNWDLDASQRLKGTMFDIVCLIWILYVPFCSHGPTIKDKNIHPFSFYPHLGPACCGKTTIRIHIAQQISRRAQLWPWNIPGFLPKNSSPLQFICLPKKEGSPLSKPPEISGWLVGWLVVLVLPRMVASQTHAKPTRSSLRLLVGRGSVPTFVRAIQKDQPRSIHRHGTDHLGSSWLFHAESRRREIQKHKKFESW